MPEERCRAARARERSVSACSRSSLPGVPRVDAIEPAAYQHHGRRPTEITAGGPRIQHGTDGEQTATRAARRNGSRADERRRTGERSASGAGVTGPGPRPI